MKTTSNPLRSQTWLKVLAEAANRQHFEFPAFDTFGMGALRSAMTSDSRFVTIKRLLPNKKSDFDGVEWALWQQLDDQPVLVAVFRDLREPDEVSLGLTLTLLKGWLVDQWEVAETKRKVSEHPRVGTIKVPVNRDTDLKSNRPKSFQAKAAASAPKNAVVVWGANGVTPTSRINSNTRLDEKYKVCA